MCKAPEHDGEARLYRFVIDRAEQGEGYGKSALREALHRIGRLDDVRRVSIRCTPRSVAACSVYLSAGFVQRGVEQDGEMIADFAMPAPVKDR